MYKGEQGGLYPGGTNTIPPAHLAAGVKLAKQIQPLDLDGNPSPDGKIVLLAIGFSNPNMEFPAFQKARRRRPGPQSQIDAGQRLRWRTGVGSDRKSRFKLLEGSEATHRQSAHDAQAGAGDLVQTGGGQSRLSPTRWRPSNWPAHYIATLQNVHKFFPNAKLAFLSNRTYGGYTEANGSPEPWAYESGFGVKWALAAQIEGKPEANYDPAKGEVRAVWAEWGPYLWTDGVKGRKDGFVYLRSDVGERWTPSRQPPADRRSGPCC